MSYAFKLGISNGQPPARCTSYVTKALGPFSATSVRILSAVAVDGQTAVAGSFGGHTETLYLRSECGSLKIVSINRLQATAPEPPSC
jgi:hypothetical protein